MKNIDEVESLRERNLRLLLAEYSNYGSPSLCHLAGEVKRKAEIRKVEVGKPNIYLNPTKFGDDYFSRVFHQRKFVSDSDAEQIEAILDLQKNWLSEDHSYLSKLISIDNKLINEIIKLTDDSKGHLVAFIESLKR